MDDQKSPWLERWTISDEDDAVFILADGVSAGQFMPCHHRRATPHDVARAKLAVAAPAMVRALLAVEDQMCTGTVLGEDQYAWPCCGAGRVEGPLCLHAEDCPLDRALTAAGLRTELMRDEARRALGLRVPHRLGDS